jgi:magnesium chelatase family protein
VSLAHRGVLFLDEAPEFSVRALEALRQPLEEGQVVLSRARGSTRYPAELQLVLAANPCPCAHPAGDAHCQCPVPVRRRYLGRLSGPLMDRVDLQIRLMPVTAAQLMQDSVAAESSATVSGRVARARAAAGERWAAQGWHANAEVPGASLRQPPWRLPAMVTRPVEDSLNAGLLSARGYDRVLRLAWTIADLDGRDRPDAGDVSEALSLRTGRTP